jgi:hypothetical protein
VVALDDGVAAFAEYPLVDAVVVVVVAAFLAVVVVVRAVVVVVRAVVVVVCAVAAAAALVGAAVVSAAAVVSLDPDPAAMAPVRTRAASALDAAVTCRARRAGWGRRRRMGMVGVLSMPR